MKDHTMKHAYIENGTVKEVARVDPFRIFQPAYAALFVPCPDDVDAGWTFDGDQWVAPVPVVPALDTLKTAKNAEINAARLAANQGTFAHAGKLIACDPLSRSDIDGINGFVALTGSLPPGWSGGWKAADNSLLPIADVAAWTAFYGSMVAAGNAHFAHSQALKAQMAAATTAEEVAAISWGG